MTPSKSNDRELNVAIIGFGQSGQIYHAPLIAAIEGLRVAAVVTSNAERAQMARDRYPGVSVFATPAVLLDNDTESGTSVLRLIEAAQRSANDGTRQELATR